MGWLLGTAEATACRQPETLPVAKTGTKQLAGDRGVGGGNATVYDGMVEVMSVSARGPCVSTTRNVVGNENSGYLW